MSVQQKKILFGFLFIVMVCAVYYFPKQSHKSDSLQNALKISAQEQKIVFLKVGESWCKPCVEMENLLTKHPKLQDLLKKFVFVKSGINNPEIKDLQVQAIPFLIFYSPDGKEIARHTGFLKADDMIVFLENILSKGK